jgi:pyruvate-formate lyase-activating enzyme
VTSGTETLLVAGTVPSSAVDGPGNRFVVFLQGCNFDCTACHNPSTIGRGDEADPSAMVRSVDDLVAEIRRLAPFLSGITVTGGEPTLQLLGLVALFGAIKDDDELRHLTTLVDTNGTLSTPGWDRLLPVLDGAMIDLKAADPSLHHDLTGASNTQVMSSVRYLAGRGKLAEVRLLVIEGVTDTDDELERWAEFVASVDADVPVRLMAFRHAGTRPEAQEWPETTPDAVDRVRHRLMALGLTGLDRPEETVMPPERLAAPFAGGMHAARARGYEG